MPFTFAHPAIVLPFIRSKKWSASALVIGSMCPDFEYFLRLKIGSVHSHTLAGLFYFNLPLGILLWFVFQQILKKPTHLALPAFLKVKTVVSSDRKSLMWVLFSVFIGACSHILWDGFTHEHGQFTEQLPFLRDTVVFHLPLYRFLQHLSTAIGFLILIIYLRKQPASLHDVTPIRWDFWISIVLVSMSFFVLFCWLMNDYSMDGNTIVRGISAFFVGWILVSWWYLKFNVTKPTHHSAN